jgi:ElaB/YqjD/DUF883 family membrane-anchored ribosome-binding protein
LAGLTFRGWRSEKEHKMANESTTGQSMPPDNGPLQRGVQQVGDSLQTTVDKMADPMHEAVNRATNAMQDGVESMTSSVKGIAEKIDERTRRVREIPDRATEQVRDYIRARPIKAIGLAFAIGWLIGRLGADD